MSCEIAPAVVDGSKTDPSIIDTGNHSNATPNGFGVAEDFRPLDLFYSPRLKNYGVEVDLIGGNHSIRHFIPPEKGPRHFTKINPGLDFLGHHDYYEMIKEPSVLLLQGCEQLFSTTLDFPVPFETFKTLMSLEISGITHLTTLPYKEISEMTQLQSLNLSHLPIQLFPNDFFSNLTNLRSLILRGCSSLHSLPEFPEMSQLQLLDLSYLLIETLPRSLFPGLENLKQLILRGCSKLLSLPSTSHMHYLEVVDLSHCTTLQELEDLQFGQSTLVMLDLSYTALPYSPVIDNCLLFTHLYMRDSKVLELEDMVDLWAISVIDLSGAQNLKDIGPLKETWPEALDLSRTGIESVDFLSENGNLRYLILRECTMLVQLPTMEGLTNLEVLDISGCELLADLPEDLNNCTKLKELNLSGCSCVRELREGLFDRMSCLEKLDLSKTNINHLPSFANLTNLRTLNISHTSVEQVPDSSYLVNLKEFFFTQCPKLQGVPAGLETLDLTPPGSGEIDCRVEGRISRPNLIHLVSTFFSGSSFDRFKQRFDELLDLISKIQEAALPNTTTNVASSNTSRPIFQRHSRSMLVDLKYILDNVDHLERSHSRTSAEELLDELLSASKFPLSASDFSPDSNNLIELFRKVAKLKLLIPRKQVDSLEDNNKVKKEFTERRRKANEWNEFRLHDTDMNTQEMQKLNRSYHSLTAIQRKCLLYFACYPCAEFPSNVKVKESILVQMWYGEGFIDPKHEENVALTIADSTESPPEIMGTNRETSPTRNDADRVSTAKGVEYHPNTIQEIGLKILTVLEEKKFIETWDNRSFLKKGRYWRLQSSADYFVRARARAERFFNLDDKYCRLTPHCTGSQIRACLLKSQSNFPSSCKLWGDYASSSKKLETFKTIRTLFNVDETVVDIRVEWFSKMRNLYVLLLGRREEKNEKPIAVVDLKFLEELKNMKQLRVLSLEGFSTITKLPYSVCKLINLKLLNLRDCGQLEELPAGIGSLTNLTHLDLKGCHTLSKLPKGVRLLSKLEVLKGFVITYQIGGRQHGNACTLRELLKLEKLRKLNLVVNTDKFPDGEDLQVFNGMKSLSILCITWENNCNYSSDRKPLRQYSRWQPLKWWVEQTLQNDTEELLGSNLQKLELCCFPSEDIVPNWLHPSKLQKLEKLYVRGGKLKTLVSDTSLNAWNVKTLVLKHLQNMSMGWEELRCSFPHMAYLQLKNCDHLRSFPLQYDGVWRIEEEERLRSTRASEADGKEGSEGEDADLGTDLGVGKGWIPPTPFT